MSSHALSVHKFMSPAPYIVGETHTLEYAATLMRQHGIRHLPVLRMGQLAGVLSSEETKAALAAPGGAARLVREVMSPNVYSVSSDTPVAEVALEMADKKHAIAVVVQRGTVVGVFTTVDGLRALHAVIRDRPPP